MIPKYALSGGIITSASGAGTTINQNAQLNQRGAFVNSDTDFKNALINEALNMPEGSEARRLAEKSDSSRLSNNKAGLLYDAFELETGGRAGRLYNETQNKKTVQAAADVLSESGVYVPKQTVTLKDGTKGVILENTGNGFIVRLADGSTKNVTADNIQKAYADDMGIFKDFLTPEKFAEIALQREQNRVDTAATKEFTDNIGKMFGIKFAFDAMPQTTEGYYTADDNTVHINEATTKADVIKSIAMHEITHGVQEAADYEGFSKALLDYAYENEAALNQAIEDKIAQYEKQGVYLTEEQALRELTAQQVRELLYSDEADIDALVNNASPNVISRIYEAIKSVIRKIRAFFKGDNNTLDQIPEYKQLDALRNRFENILNENAQNAAQNETISQFEPNLEQVPQFSENNSEDLPTRRQGAVMEVTDPRNRARYEREIDGVFTGQLSTGEEIIMGRTPQILNKYGAPDLPLNITQDTVRKIAYPEGYQGGKHNLGIGFLKTLPDQLSDPIAILKSNTQNDSVVVITEYEDTHGDRVIVPIHFNKNGSIGIENTISSAYGRPKLSNLWKNNADNILYTKNNKSIDSLLSVGLQLPGAGLNALDNNISNTNNSVNPQNKQFSIKDELPYTDEEIVRSYRQAENKKEQIKVLSELNDCTQKKIKEVLARNGEIEAPVKPAQKSQKSKTNKTYQKAAQKTAEDKTAEITEPLNNTADVEAVEETAETPNATKTYQNEFENAANDVIENSVYDLIGLESSREFSKNNNNERRTERFKEAVDYAKAKFGEQNVLSRLDNGSYGLLIKTGNGSVIIPAGTTEGNLYYPSDEIVNYKNTFGDMPKANTAEQNVIDTTPLDPRAWAEQEAKQQNKNADEVYINKPEQNTVNMNGNIVDTNTGEVVSEQTQRAARADKLFGEQNENAKPKEKPSSDLKENTGRALEKGKRQIDIDAKREGKAVKKKLTDLWNWINLKAVNSSHVADKISPGTKTALNSARSASKSADYNIGTDRGKQSGRQTDIYGRGNYGKSLTEIFKPINEKGKEYASDFNNYMYQLLQSDRMSIEARAEEAVIALNKRIEQLGEDSKTVKEYEDYLNGLKSFDRLTGDALQLAKDKRVADILGEEKNKPVFTAEIDANAAKNAAAELLNRHPEFAEYEKEIRGFVKNNMNNRVASGLITQDFADTLELMYPHYVPVSYQDGTLNEIADFNDEEFIVGKTVKRAQGAEDLTIGSLERALAAQTRGIFVNGRANIAANQMADALFAMEDGERKAVQGSGAKITYFTDGVLNEIEVSPEIREAFKGLEPKADNAALKAVSKATHFFKNLTTQYNPGFLVRNMFKDYQDASIYTKHGTLKFAGNYASAVKGIKNNSAEWQLYQSAGGFTSSVFDSIMNDTAANRGKGSEFVKAYAPFCVFKISKGYIKGYKRI